MYRQASHQVLVLVFALSLYTRAHIKWKMFTKMYNTLILPYESLVPPGILHFVLIDSKAQISKAIGTLKISLILD